MKKIMLLIGWLMTSTLFARNLDEAFQILPQPQSIKMLPGKGINGNELKYIVADAHLSFPILGANISQLPQSKRRGKGITLTLSSTEVPDSPEGYILLISDKGVSITARAKEGLFYGCQTLEQLWVDHHDFGKPIPAMKIIDYPAIPYRAIHFDTKHHLSNMEYYYRLINKLASYKINAIIWELEDKLRFTRRPEMGAPNAISKQEMQSLCRYAKERNIEISPLIQGLGHAGFILKHHWELRENPYSDWEFCPSDSRTYEVQFDLYLDALEAMPYGKYLHVGGDEITAIGIDDRCKATGKTAFELQMIWLQKVCAFAIKHGRTPIFWDDMPLKYANVWNTISNEKDTNALQKLNLDRLDNAIDLFPKECVYMRWMYGNATTPVHQRLLKWYSDKGLKVMGATAAAAGDSPFLPRNNSRIPSIKGFSELVAKNQLEGIIATSWDDGSPHWETVVRGYIAQGEFGWNPTARTIETFKKAHAQREFGFHSDENRMQFLDELEKAFFFFDGALVVSGKRNPAWGTANFTLIDLPEEAHLGAWSEKYKEKIAQAKKEKQRYEVIQKGIQQAKENALRNRYTLEIYEQTNELQHYPTRLILSLHAYDSTKDEASRQQEKAKIAAICDSFPLLRSHLEWTYSQTRFMQQPEGFLSDMNHHLHLSAKSNNSDWLYLYEMPMVKKVRDWLKKK